MCTQHSLLTFLCPAIACVHSDVCVEQRPSTVDHTMGENVTMSCEICADGRENISKCRIEWYRQSEDGSLPEIRQLSQFRGRFHELTDSRQWRGSLLLTALELNDTGRYYCNYLCLINETLFQHNGNGTNLSVHEEAITTTTAAITTTTGYTDAEKTTDDILYTFILFLPVSLKLIVSVFLGTYTLFSFYVRCYCLLPFTSFQNL
ncbi:hypothetical protein NFI96_019430, partial [Prochilodus magdalenae]